MRPARLRRYWLKIWVTSQSRLDEFKKYGRSFRNGGSIGHTEVDADWRRDVIHKQGFERSIPDVRTHKEACELTNPDTMENGLPLCVGIVGDEASRYINGNDFLVDLEGPRQSLTRHGMP